MNESCPLDKMFLFLKFFFVSLKKTTFEILSSEVWKGGFQLMLILVLLGMYFDAAVVFVTSQTLLFRLPVAILWDMNKPLFTVFKGKKEKKSKIHCVSNSKITKIMR